MAAPTDQMLMLSVLGKEMTPEFEFAGRDGTDEDREITAQVFGKTRRWRFDYAIPHQRIAWEIEGGHWTGGRHNTGSGFEKDIEKYNHATLLDWRVIRSTTSTKSRTEALETIKRIMA